MLEIRSAGAAISFFPEEPTATKTPDPLATAEARRGAASRRIRFEEEDASAGNYINTNDISSTGVSNANDFYPSYYQTDQNQNQYQALSYPQQQDYSQPQYQQQLQQQQQSQAYPGQQQYYQQQQTYRPSYNQNQDYSQDYSQQFQAQQPYRPPISQYQPPDVQYPVNYRPPKPVQSDNRYPQYTATRPGPQYQRPTGGQQRPYYLSDYYAQRPQQNQQSDPNYAQQYGYYRPNQAGRPGGSGGSGSGSQFGGGIGAAGPPGGGGELLGGQFAHAIENIVRYDDFQCVPKIVCQMVGNPQRQSTLPAWLNAPSLTA